MNPKRRFFQIHLSTAVVLMLVAGVLVWANVREAFSPYLDRTGWPFHFKRLISAFKAYDGQIVTRYAWSTAAVVLNLVIALAILLIVCVACEWRIRRRAARKAAE